MPENQDLVSSVDFLSKGAPVTGCRSSGKENFLVDINLRMGLMSRLIGSVARLPRYEPHDEHLHCPAHNSG